MIKINIIYVDMTQIGGYDDITNSKYKTKINN